MAMFFKLFYKSYGVRKVSQLLSPTPIRVTSLPKSSILHYLDFENPDVDPESLIIKSFSDRKIFLDLITEYKGETEGSFKKLNKVPRSLIRDYLRENRNFKYVNDAYLTNDNPNILTVENYGYLSEVYKYVSINITDLHIWSNTFGTAFNLMNTIGEKKRNANQFIFLDVPKDIPGYSNTKLYEDKEGVQFLRVFNTPSKFLMMEFWKWFDPETRKDSLLSNIEDENLSTVNIVLGQDGAQVLINLGYLNSFIEGQENRTDINNVKQLSVKRIRQLFIYMVVTLKDSLIQNEIQETEEDKDEYYQDAEDVEDDLDDDSADYEDIEEETESSPKKNELKALNKLEKAKYKSLKKRKDSSKKIKREEEVDVDKELDNLDEVMSDYDKKETIEEINEGEITSEKETELTLEELEKKFLTEDSIEDNLSLTIDTLAEKGVISKPQAKKLKNKSTAYLETKSPYDPNKKSSEFIGYEGQDISLDKELSTMNTPDTVLDKTMDQSSVKSLDTGYLNGLYKKDIQTMVHSLQKTGVMVTNHEIEKENSPLGEFDIHRLSLVPLDGKPSTVIFKLPTISKDGTFKAAGNKYVMRKQRVDVPIRKISPNKVQLSTYYGKNFIETERTMSSSSTEFLAKRIYKLYSEGTIDKLVPGSVFDNYFEAPYIYSSLGSRFQSLKKGTIEFVFDRKRVKQETDEKTLEYLEKNGSLVAGNVGKGAKLVVDKDDNFYKADKNGLESLGKITDILEIEESKMPLVFSEMRIYTKQIPVCAILGYLVGLKNLFKLLKIKPRYEEGTRTPPAASNELKLRFSEGSYYLDKKHKTATIILSGLNSFKTLKKLNSTELDYKAGYFKLFTEKEISSVYVKEIDISNKLFVDPISADLLKRMKEPETFIGLLIRSSELLTKYTYPDSQDLDYMRIRGYERVSGFIYKELAKSIKTYHNKNISGRSKVDISPYKVWGSLTEDKTIKLIEDTNPLVNLKEHDVVTYIGEGGQDKQSIKKSTRKFHRTDYGVVSEATVDSGDVAVNAFLTANPNISDLRGQISKNKDINQTNRLSVSANLAPFSLNDDGKRVNYTSIMNSHIISTKQATAPVVRTGYEYIIPRRNSDLFAFSAKDDGKVTSVKKDGMVVEYKDGTKEGVSLGKLFGDAEGSHYPFTVSTTLKEGEKFKKDDILAYNTNFYEPDLLNPKEVILKTTVNSLVALPEANSTYEDSFAITSEFSKKMVSQTTKIKAVTLMFNQNVTNLVKEGDKVNPDDALLLIEDEITSGYKFDSKSIDVLKDLSKQAPKSKYKGTIDRVEVFYNGDKEDMSESLREAVDKSDKALISRRKNSGKSTYTGRVTDDYRSNGARLGLDTLEIKFYITVDNSMGIGDKGILANQMKATVGEVMDYSIETDKGDKIEALFSFKSIYARLVLSPVLTGTTTTLMRVIGEKAVKIYRGKN